MGDEEKAEKVLDAIRNFGSWRLTHDAGSNPMRVFLNLYGPHGEFEVEGLVVDLDTVASAMRVCAEREERLNAEVVRLTGVLEETHRHHRNVTGEYYFAKDLLISLALKG